MITRRQCVFGFPTAFAPAEVALSAGARQATDKATTATELFENSAHADATAYGFSRWSKAGFVAPDCAVQVRP